LELSFNVVGYHITKLYNLPCVLSDWPLLQDELVKSMSLELMQLPCEEDSDFFGDKNLQVYAVYSSDLKADRGSFIHGKMSSIPPVNPIVIAMIFILVRHAFLVV
jgi:hypothetical protein